MRVKTVLQSEHSECGLASAACVLLSLGRKTSLNYLREEYGSSKGGLSFSNIHDILANEGIEYKGIRIEDGLFLSRLEKPSILLWEDSHLVVLYGVRFGRLLIMDPKLGKVSYSKEEFLKGFSGYALIEDSTCGNRSHVSTRGEQHADKELEFRHMFLSLFSEKKLMAFGILLTSLIIKLLTLTVPILSQAIIDGETVLGSFPAGIPFLALGAFFLLHYLSSVANGLLLTKLELDWTLSLSSSFMENAINKPLEFFINRSAGSMIYKSSLMTLIQRALSNNVIQNAVDFVFLFIYLLFMLLLSPLLSLLSIIICLIIAIVSIIFSIRNYIINNTVMELQSDLQQLSVEVFSGVETIKSLGMEQAFYSKWVNKLTEGIAEQNRQGRNAAWIASLSYSLMFALPLTILLVGYYLALENVMTFGEVVAFMTLSTYFVDPFSKLINSISQIMLINSYMNQIRDVFSQSGKKISGEIELAEIDEIQLQNIDYRYSYFEPAIIKNVSLDIHKGDKIAIVGKSGSGKSTLLKLICGLLLPTEGMLQVNGLPYESYDMLSWKSLVNYTPQQSFIFNDTLGNNLAVTEDVLMEDFVVDALKATGVDELIDETNAGTMMILSENGRNVSGGQAQKIAVVRSLLKKPALLAMDEPTSALDAITEDKLIDYLLRSENTLIIAAHRLSLAKKMNQIIVLDSGEIVEKGSHDQLLKKRGVYWNLYHCLER